MKVQRSSIAIVLAVTMSLLLGYSNADCDLTQGVWTSYLDISTNTFSRDLSSTLEFDSDGSFSVALTSDWDGDEYACTVTQTTTGTYTFSNSTLTTVEATCSYSDCSGDCADSCEDESCVSDDTRTRVLVFSTDCKSFYDADDPTVIYENESSKTWVWVTLGLVVVVVFGVAAVAGVAGALLWKKKRAAASGLSYYEDA